MLVLCGKSASGKDTLKKELINMGMNPVVTYTTRPPRPGETNGVDYHFIGDEEFQFQKDRGFFAETASYDVVSGDRWYYGSALEDLTNDKIIVLSPSGVRNIRKIKEVNSIVFYIMANQRIRLGRSDDRGDNKNEVSRRLVSDELDFANIDECIDFSVRNDGSLEPIKIAEIIYHVYNKMIGDNKWTN